MLACAELIERLGREQPGRLAELREKVSADLAEVIGGPYREREDPLLPVESQLWNLLHGQAVYRDLLGKDVQVFTDHTAGLNSLQFLGDGRTLVTASADKTARLLDVGVVSAIAAHPAGAEYELALLS